jgi:hypothetical protein
MARIIVHKFAALTRNELTELLALLAAAGFECDPELDLADLEELLAAREAEQGESEDPKEWVLIVILSPECDADGGLSQAVGKVSRAGGRVIGVWPHGGGEGRVPAAMERHGSDTVPWDAERVRVAISGETVSWATPTGAPRAEPATRRNKC